jgi:maltose/maltodextrin transport system substrate-binding protein
VIQTRKALACAFVAGLLAAAPAAIASEPLKLLVWINGDKGYNGLQKVGDRFEAESGVQVVVQHPEGAPDKFQSSTGAGKGPDIFCWPHDRVGEWARSGLIVPVYPRQKLRDTIEPSAWQAFEYKGKTWGYPLAIEAIGLIFH